MLSGGEALADETSVWEELHIPHFEPSSRTHTHTRRARAPSQRLAPPAEKPSRMCSAEERVWGGRDGRHPRDPGIIYACMNVYTRTHTHAHTCAHLTHKAQKLKTPRSHTPTKSCASFVRNCDCLLCCPLWRISGGDPGFAHVWDLHTLHTVDYTL